MTDTHFNTLAVAKRLEAGGFSAEKAEAITDAVHMGVTGGVATKADLARVENNLKWVIWVGGGALLLAAPLWMKATLSLFSSGG